MADTLQQFILASLEKKSEIADTRQLILPGKSDPAISQEDQLIILGALNSLSSREMIAYTSHEISSHVLTSEGSQIVLQGSHEARVWAALPPKGSTTGVKPQQLKEQVGDETAKVGQGRAFKSGWIAKVGDGLVQAVCGLYHWHAL